MFFVWKHHLKPQIRTFLVRPCTSGEAAKADLELTPPLCQALPTPGWSCSLRELPALLGILMLLPDCRLQDMNREVVKTDCATARIPELDFEIPAFTQKGGG